MSISVPRKQAEGLFHSNSLRHGVAQAFSLWRIVSQLLTVEVRRRH